VDWFTYEPGTTKAANQGHSNPNVTLLIRPYRPTSLIRGVCAPGKGKKSEGARPSRTRRGTCLIGHLLAGVIYVRALRRKCAPVRRQSRATARPTTSQSEEPAPVVGIPGLGEDEGATGGATMAMFCR
jgi:hypothetical protein